MREGLLPVMLFMMFMLNACVSIPSEQCPAGTLNLPDCPPQNAVGDKKIDAIYKMRTWVSESDLTIDPIKLGTESKIPINSAGTKIIGPSFEAALDSIAVKISMIENAQHTVDSSYYIFDRDRIGYALLGAMCNAVKRGVDVRIMVDGLGSFHPMHSELKALETCAENAGFMRNAAGKITTKKARVQVVIFNSFTKLQFNRRSHDKILIVDGAFADKAIVISGGRNISLHYYGIHEDGSKDPDTFRDLELLIKSGKDSGAEEYSVGKVSGIYYGLLFMHKGNSRIRPSLADGEFSEGTYADSYIYHREKSQQDLLFLKNLPEIKQRLQAMPTYMAEGFHESNVRLSHQLSNLTNDRVATNVEENLKRNPNSILYLLDKASKTQKAQDITSGVLRIVSPYLFSGLYKNEEGEIIYDGTKETLEWLEQHPNVRLEVITNSVMTGDNIFTQAIIDMDMAPRFLLTPELQKKWLYDYELSEFNPDIVESDEWKRLVNHPQVFIYQTGKLDAVMLGGDANYGKLHAKFIIGENFSFIGTSNFDYRSNLYNNEMGFFIQSDELRDDLNEVFEALKKTSYRWGSAEWLEMRKKLMESENSKGDTAKEQRAIFKTIRGLGLEYLM
jgi:phosphatidylserine/phosphatidylglycerophosphate/cardiolipin synthase-like enzyme